MAQELNLTQTAKLLKLTPARVHQLAAQGTIERKPGGSFDMIQAVHGYIDFLRENTVQNVKGSMSLSEAKQRRAIAQAMLLELELKLQQGEVIKAMEVLPQWERLVQACRNKLLAIPSKAAPMLVQQESMTYINNLMTDLIIEALNELAKGSEIEILEEEDEETEPELSEDDLANVQALGSSTPDGNRSMG